MEAAADTVCVLETSQSLPKRLLGLCHVVVRGLYVTDDFKRPGRIREA